MNSIHLFVMYNNGWYERDIAIRDSRVSMIMPKQCLSFLFSSYFFFILFNNELKFSTHLHTLKYNGAHSSSLSTSFIQPCKPGQCLAFSVLIETNRSIAMRDSLNRNNHKFFLSKKEELIMWEIGADFSNFDVGDATSAAAAVVIIVVVVITLNSCKANGFELQFVNVRTIPCATAIIAT